MLKYPKTTAKLLKQVENSLKIPKTHWKQSKITQKHVEMGLNQSKSH